MEIIIVGNGGHSKVIQDMIDSLKNDSVVAILDDKYQVEFEQNGIKYGPLSLIRKYLYLHTKVVIAIGNNKIRKKIVHSLALKSDQYATLIHPSAVVSSNAKIGNGTVIMPNAVINTEAQIGEHCIINSSAIVEHENQIGHYTHLSPNVTLTGNVTVSEGVHIGAAATVIPNITIGRWSVIGAGSTVIQSIPANCTAVGSPTRIIEKIVIQDKFII
ncbi:acetyltransferase [Jeotgalibacillus soli]|uniref:Acetyltransferase n=1 Tax=Jeotgalibacillus soli TaxID=889306 RepID=A0A0C2VZG8_9BACL|nr:acetyltransferase [Jeotgalibacillus soli]KIL49353.1 acetyltransferase [Jeotgalibacillus soli]